MMSMTIGSLGQLLVDRGFVPRDQVDRVVAASAPRDGSDLLLKLVQQGDLTKFQAKTIDRGQIDSLCFGPYVILDMIGKGGMSVIFRARHRHMQRFVALKVISPEIEKDPTAVQRFWREVHAIAQLDHPHIVKAYDAGEEAGRMYLAMELIQGVNCSELVKNRGPAKPALALKIIGQAASGLAYSHASGIVHRDVKPSNLFINEKGLVKVLDLGLALLQKGPTESTAETGLTRTGIVMGTADYMAPEQARGRKDLDGRADVYSLGCTLYFLLTGQRPFHGANVIDVILAHTSAPIPGLEAAGVHGLPDVEALLRRMMEKEPRRRIASMEEVVEAVASLRGSRPGAGKSPDTDRTIRMSEIHPAPAELVLRPVAEDRKTADGKRSSRNRPDPDSGGVLRPKSDSIPSFMDVSPLAPAAATEPRKRSPMVWGGGMIGAAIVAGGLLYFAPWRRAEVPAAGTAAAAPPTNGEVRLDLSGDLKGIDLTINGGPHPAEPSTSLALDPGRYEIVAKRRGTVVKRHVFQLQAGQHLSVVLDLGAVNGNVQEFKVR